MYTEILNPKDVSRLRVGVDPDSVWFTDDELSHIIRVSNGILDKAVVRCFLGIQQKARAKQPADTVGAITARNNLNRFEAGFLDI